MFGDEAGDNKFKATCSNYYMIGTVCMTVGTLAQDLWELRRDLTESGDFTGTFFHACNDTWPVRNAVFQLIASHQFKFDATVIEKRKTEPHLVRNKQRFYKQAWFFHMSKIGKNRVRAGQSLFLVAASQKSDHNDMSRIKRDLDDICNQTLAGRTFTTACWPSASDPWLQVADYCSWAVQRKYERGDDTCMKLISSQIDTLYHPFHHGAKRY